MKNLDQIRAKNALAAADTGYKGVNEGEVVKKVPTMIRENGILGALAFAAERNDKGKLKNEGHYSVFGAIITHLRSVKRIPDASMTVEQFIEHLAEVDATQLREITAETMAYLNYLRRFAGKKGGRE
ncbi:MAG: type III-B CRISPR module-associated protein Cmr5 [Kiritimatiellaeota bacterium]|nr:type III-B CRISPR module-associated protein Cmr5 [Kiritimatiellota bacterium]